MTPQYLRTYARCWLTTQADDMDDVRPPAVGPTLTVEERELLTHVRDIFAAREDNLLVFAIDALLARAAKEATRRSTSTPATALPRASALNATSTAGCTRRNASAGSSATRCTGSGFVRSSWPSRWSVSVIGAARRWASRWGC